MSDWDELRDPTLLPPRSARGCPPGETWTDLVAGAPLAGDRDALLDHLAACPDCANEVRALREVAAWSRQAAGESEVVPHRESNLVRWPWVAALAAVILLPFLTLVIRRESLPEPGVRGTSTAAARIEPGDGAQLNAAPSVLRWSPVAGAREYRVQLLDDEGSLLWTSPPLSDTSVSLPGDVRERLKRGSSYLWRVEILLDGDRRTSPTYEFRLAP